MCIVGQGTEYLLMVFEEERMVTVDAEKQQHIQRINDILSGHKVI